MQNHEYFTVFDTMVPDKAHTGFIISLQSVIVPSYEAMRPHCGNMRMHQELVA